MQQTTNYGFALPESNDTYNVNDNNGNFQMLDATLKEISDSAGGDYAEEIAQLQTDVTNIANGTTEIPLQLANGTNLGGIRLEVYTAAPETFNTNDCLTLITEE